MDMTNRYHLSDEDVQIGTLMSVSHGLTIDTVDVVCGHIYTAMDANLTSEMVQFTACWAIFMIVRESPDHKRVLLETRAVEVCARARSIFPRNRRVDIVLAYLQNEQ